MKEAKLQQDLEEKGGSAGYISLWFVYTWLRLVGGARAPLAPPPPDYAPELNMLLLATMELKRIGACTCIIY